MAKESETTKVREAVAIAQQISELKRKLKLLEKGMSLKEFIAYVDGTRPNQRQGDKKKVPVGSSR